MLLDSARIVLWLLFASPWTRLEAPGILEALLVFLADSIILGIHSASDVSPPPLNSTVFVSVSLI